MKFLVDAQLPPALARWLREAGHDADHAEDLNLREAEDLEIWQRALSLGAALITKDEDFPDLARHNLNGPIIIWLRVGNVSNRALRVWFLPQLPQILEWIQQGVRILEIR